MKKFNTTGTCFPDKHYMVDISDRLARIKTMVDDGAYFSINRGRQYGKTTTLRALEQYLKDEYTVFRISFERLSDASFASMGSIVMAFADMLKSRLTNGIVRDQEGKLLTAIGDLADKIPEENVAYKACSNMVYSLVRASSKPVVVIIDEVDRAGNFDSFIRFLALLRDMYLDREDVPTFHSIILAGVYDIKNLKLKMRSEDEHQYNSPWNIAAPFDEDMSLSEEGVAGMLADYENDHHTGMNIAAIAKLLREYTSGYPYLVSRLCQLLDKSGMWSQEGFLAAVKALLNEENTLFDDLHKKLLQYPHLTDLLRQVLYYGRSINSNYYDTEMGLAIRFGFVKSGVTYLTVSNRIFETFLYNYFVTESDKQELIFTRSRESKSIFVKSDNTLDMPLILKRFTETFNEIYGDRGERFLEDEGRRYFMLYIKPIINGIGNYYIEAETRDGTKTDMIIDYLGERYVVEMKIWRGNAYNERGEKQLTDYLNYFDVKQGYMVSFCFNKNKIAGLKPPIVFGDKTIIEAVV